MSAFGSTFAGNPFSVGPSGSVDPFGGTTPWGFSIPQGDPGELEAAARAASETAGALILQSGSVNDGARMALGGWSGEAEAAFVAYTGHVTGVLDANSEAIGSAAQALAELGRELETAQRATREAASQCELYHGRMTTAQNDAGRLGAQASTLEQQAATAVHPQVQTALNHQAGLARDQQGAAERAATTAQNDFEAWQRRGRQAAETYAHLAEALSRRIAAAAERIRNVSPPAGGAPVPVSLRSGDGALARRMLSAAGGLQAALAAAGSPAALERLAGGHLTPGATLLYTQAVQRMASQAETAKPQQGSLLDGLGGFVNTATFGAVSFGNSNTARYRGGELAAMIPINPDSLVVDGERGLAKLGGQAVSDGHATGETGVLSTVINGHRFDVTVGDTTPLTSAPREGRVVYRTYGQPADEQGVVPVKTYSRPDGHSWSPVSPARYKAPRDGLGLPSENGMRFVIKGRITDSSGILVRRALPLDGTRGGGLEYVVPNPDGQIEIISVHGLNPGG